MLSDRLAAASEVATLRAALEKHSEAVPSASQAHELQLVEELAVAVREQVQVAVESAMADMEVR